MIIPFTAHQFFEIFAAYNTAVAPVQFVLLALASITVVLAWRPIGSARRIAAILAFFWVWTGVAYHWLFFARINRAALAAGALFGVLLWAESEVPWHLLAAPLLWAVIGSAAVFAFGVVEAAGLIVAGIVAGVLIVRRNARLRARLIPACSRLGSASTEAQERWT